MKSKLFLLLSLSAWIKMLSFLAATFLVSSNAYAAELPEPSLTKDEAVSKASTFYRRFGYQASLSAATERPAPARSSSKQSSAFVEDCWRVILKSGKDVQATIDVSGKDRKIVYYLPEVARLPSGERKEEVTSEGQATQKAKSFLRSVDGSLVEKLSFELKDGYGAYEDKAQKEWFIRARRLYKGVPYNSQGPIVTIDKATGAIKGFNLLFDTPEPTSSSIDVTPDQAVDIAAQQFISKSPLSETEKGVEVALQVVQPNKYWEHGGQSEKLFESRLAWVCRYKRSDKLWWREVWVDAETGKVIGGTSESLSVSPLEYAETNSVMNLLINRYVRAEDFITRSTKLLSTSEKLTISSPNGTASNFDSPFGGQVTYFHKASVITREPDISFTIPGFTTTFGFYKGVGVIAAKLEQKIGDEQVKDWVILGVATKTAAEQFDKVSLNP